ncbi:MAG: hypothetical protein R3A48_02430 [Polyangiales bacterium]
MIDIARILTAAHLGLSATAALLLTAIALAADGRRRALAAALVFVSGALGVTLSVVRMGARAATALDGLALAAALSCALLAPGVRSWVSRLPPAALAAVGVLRLAGLDALAASHAGWLPVGAARAFAAIEGGAAALAVAAALLAARNPRAARWVLAASVVSAAATATLALRGARPLPGFVALYVGPLLGLCALASVAAIAALAGAKTDASARA